MAISRGQFLRSLGASLPGYALGSAAAIASKLLAAGQAPTIMPPRVTPPQTQPRAAEVECIKSGPATGRRIALTFDDGPEPGVTDKILDELKARNCLATFFMIGRQVAAHPDLARRVLAEGHEIGNHTATHRKLTTLPDDQVEQELHDAERTFEDLLQHKPRWFRPPFNEFRKTQARLATCYGLQVVLGSLDSFDWMGRPGADTVRHVLEKAVPGSIIVCHDTLPETAHFVGSILDGLRDKNLEPVTLSTLLAP
jgi:peptidoglycan/xylan/chitin deacetylase (PgdA/CDA1 family)